MENTTESYSATRFSASVLMETQLRSRLEEFNNLEGAYVVLPVTLTNGNIAIANFDTTVWPQWIQSGIKSKLLSVGGVLSESPLQVVQNSKGSLSVLRAKKPVTKSPASIVELVTDDDDPK